MQKSKNPHVTERMILGRFFLTTTVTASHIVGLYERNLCPNLGIDDVWDDRNGILLFHDIDQRFKSMDLVSILCQFTFFISLPYDFALFVDILTQPRRPHYSAQSFV